MRKGRKQWDGFKADRRKTPPVFVWQKITQKHVDNMENLAYNRIINKHITSGGIYVLHHQEKPHREAVR